MSPPVNQDRVRVKRTGVGSSENLNMNDRKAIHVCIVTTAHSIDDVRVRGKVADSFLTAGFRVSWVGPGHATYKTESGEGKGIDYRLVRGISTRFDRLISRYRVFRLVAAVEGVDVYYAPDPDSAPIAVKMAQENGAKAIFDIHEIYHGPMLDRWLCGFDMRIVRETVRRRVARVCEQCDLVMGVSDSVLEHYIQENERRLVVRSCAPSWFADGPAADVCGASRTQFSIIHGKFGLDNGTDKVLEAMALAHEKDRRLRVIMFATRDPTTEAAMKKFNEMAQDRIANGTLDLRNSVPMQEMPAVIRNCDLGLIAYGRSFGLDSLPNRLFEYMAAGVPVVAPVYSREIARIVTAEECGVLADFEDPHSIAAAIMELARNPERCREMGRRGRKAFLERHNWDVEVQPLLETIRSWFVERR